QATTAPGDYDLFIDGVEVQTVTIETENKPDQPTNPGANNPTDVTFEKTQYGTYQVKWKGNAKAAVELKQSGVTAYKANGSLNKAVFQATTAPGDYDLFIDGVEVQTVTIE
ncbi:hypothetical protein, partial [Desulfitobacterium chlororespirans]